MSGEVTGTALGASGPVNGATVDIWLASRTWPGGLPAAQGAAPPTGAPDFGPVTSGTSFGGPGAFTITSVTSGDYLIRVNTGGINYWSQQFSVVENSEVAHLAGVETITGNKTFSGQVTLSGTVVVSAGLINVSALTGTLPIANGGTGSSSQNFVDLTTGQTMAGTKQFSGTPVFQNGFTVSSGTLTFQNGSIPSAAVAGLSASFAGVDIGSTQTLTGPKTVSNDFTVASGKLVGSTIASPAAPTLTNQGAAGSTTYQYQIVATTQDGRDSIPSLEGFTTTGNASLTSSNYNHISWSAVTNAASYKILKLVSGAWKSINTGITATTYDDKGADTPQTYSSTTNANPGGEATPTTVTSPGDVTTNGGQFIGNAVATPAAPTATPTGANNGVNYRYEIVAVTNDGRDSIPSAAGQTNVGATALSYTNFNTVTWTAVPNAASYKVLKYNGSIYQLLQANVTGTSFVDYGDITPGAYTAVNINPGGEVQSTFVQANANVASVVAARFVGLVPAGGPASATWSTGDWGWDSLGYPWFCTAGGTPGTWVSRTPRGTPATGTGYAQVTANQSGISTITDLTSLTVTVTQIANRIIKVTGICNFLQNTSANTPNLFLREGATTLASAQQTQEATFVGTLFVLCILTPGAGSHTYKLSMSTGAGTVTMTASATAPAYILVEDVGSVL